MLQANMGPVQRAQIERAKKAKANLMRPRPQRLLESAAPIQEPEAPPQDVHDAVRIQILNDEVRRLAKENKELLNELHIWRRSAKPTTGESKNKGVMRERLIRIVSLVSKIPVHILVGPRRSRPVVFWRRIIQHILYHHPAFNYSLTQVGNVTGGRDHTTVLHAIRMVDKERHKYENEMANVEKIMEEGSFNDKIGAAN